jgi:hypothetical protein
MTKTKTDKFSVCRFFFFEQRTRRNTSMSRPHDEESEFKEFIDQINALQQMQGTEQEELNQQQSLNVDLMEDLVKCMPK